MLCLVDTEDKMFPAAWSGEDDKEKGRSNVDEEEKKIPGKSTYTLDTKR